MREIERVAPPPAALPVDGKKRTLIGQQAARLLRGDETMAPAAWARLALAGARLDAAAEDEDDDGDSAAEDAAAAGRVAVATARETMAAAHDGEDETETLPSAAGGSADVGA